MPPNPPLERMATTSSLPEFGARSRFTMASASAKNARFAFRASGSRRSHACRSSRSASGDRLRLEDGCNDNLIGEARDYERSASLQDVAAKRVRARFEHHPTGAIFGYRARNARIVLLDGRWMMREVVDDRYSIDLRFSLPAAA